MGPHDDEEPTYWFTLSNNLQPTEERVHVHARVVDVVPASISPEGFEIKMYRISERELVPLEPHQLTVSTGGQVVAGVAAHLPKITSSLPKNAPLRGLVVTAFIKVSVGSLTETKVMQLRFTN